MTLWVPGIWDARNRVLWRMDGMWNMTLGLDKDGPHMVMAKAMGYSSLIVVWCWSHRSSNLWPQSESTGQKQDDNLYWGSRSCMLWESTKTP